MSKLDKIRSNIFPYYEDFIDRLSFQISIILLLLIIIVVGMMQIVGQTIQCFTPQEFTNAWETYTERYCYSLGTYYNGISVDDINKTEVISNHKTISSMLFTQALFIFINYMLWRLLMLKSELNLQRIMETAKESNNFQNRIKCIANQIDNNLNKEKIYNSSLIWRLMSYINGGCCMRYSGNYHSILYIIIKIIYLLNVVGQIYLMKRFIGTSYSFYGAQVLYDAVKSAKWSNSVNFPNKIFCELEINKLNRIYKYSIQCVLSINIFLEKIFIFLWFWFIIIGCFSAISLIRWLNKLINSKHRIRYIKEYIQITDKSCEGQFIFDYLKRDGFFIINLISNNISDIVAGDVICNLWDLYSNKNRNEYEQFKKYEENECV